MLRSYIMTGRRDRDVDQTDPTPMVYQLRNRRDILAVEVPNEELRVQAHTGLPSPGHQG